MMPESHGLRAYPEANAILLSDDTSRDQMQASGRWIRSDTVRENKP